MTDTSGRLRRRDGVLAQEAHGEVALLRLQDGSYFTIGDVAARVWELCDGTQTVDEIVRTIGDEFDAPEDVIRADVTTFVKELRDEGLLDDSD